MVAICAETLCDRNNNSICLCEGNTSICIYKQHTQVHMIPSSGFVITREHLQPNQNPVRIVHIS
jgi:hypothetical protein